MAGGHHKGTRSGGHNDGGEINPLIFLIVNTLIILSGGAVWYIVKLFQ